MSGHSPLEVHAMQASVRFIQGYRYLDRCGEALVKLENVLAEGWIPSETTPKAGSLKNDQLGMRVSFNSELMTTHQDEGISFQEFLDQTCKVFDVLWQLFEIKRINLPSVRVFLQKGFKDGELDEASAYLFERRLCVPQPGLTTLMGGKVNALEFVLVTTEDKVWSEVLVHQRRRIQSQVVLQEKQPPFDERLLRRARQLPGNQRAAIEALLKLRRQHREVFPVAVQFDLEHSLETEFTAETFDLPTFLQEGWMWAKTVRDEILGLPAEKS